MEAEHADSIHFFCMSLSPSLLDCISVVAQKQISHLQQTTAIHLYKYNASKCDCDHNCGYFAVYTNQGLSVLMILFKPRLLLPLDTERGGCEPCCQYVCCSVS